MKKDIQIPEVSGVEIAVVYEYNALYKTDDWNIYIINNKNVDLEMIVIVSQGFSETKTTSLLRKKLAVLPADLPEMKIPTCIIWGKLPPNNTGWYFHFRQIRGQYS